MVQCTLHARQITEEAHCSMLFLRMHASGAAEPRWDSREEGGGGADPPGQRADVRGGVPEKVCHIRKTRTAL